VLDPFDHETFALALSPRAMTPAERQKKLRELRKATGVKPLHVTPDERCQLAAALHLLAQLRPQSDVSALLAKLSPGGVADELQAEVADLLSVRSALSKSQSALEVAERELAALRAKQSRDEQEYALTLRERGTAWDDNERLRAESKRLTAENGRLQTQLASITADLVGILGQPSADVAD